MLDGVLRSNALILFNLDGSERHLDFERHLDLEHRTPRVSNRVEARLALDLLASWELHILRSSYKSRYFGAVQLTERWLRHQDGSPPVVILKNVDFRDPSEKPARLSVLATWPRPPLLKALAYTTFTYEDEKYYRVRLTLNNGRAQRARGVSPKRIRGFEK
jgi:hypothetical protein